ncbi:hypothetical protein ACGFU4_36145 [Streptomyces sp. NPDC048511]|uniref:hypothetical protein n=1 Tax=Streptomyces sp. NPDC048511 TaxID=3365562 RepID=UPI003720BEAF
MTDIGVTLAQLQKRIDRLERASRLSSASLDDTALEVRDGAGSLRGVFGQQGDGTTAALVVNGPPPPQPSAPIVASVLGGVTASWDGLFVDGQVLPLDWSRTEVHASTTSGFIPAPATLRSTIETAQGATVVIPTDDPVYVRLVARSTSGTPSDPSVEVGPYGPAPVVATDILDGIVTTLKLADDAVTAAKVATGAIGSTEIADNAVTTPKIIAGAVQTAQLDALAVNASKIAAGAVTTAKLDALAVTADKVDANAITVGKLAAGSVDATALKADAITGKTITGGVINGAEFHSDNGAGGLVDIENGNVIATGPNNWKAMIDTDGFTPAIGFLDSTGATAGAIFGSGNDDLPNLRLASGTFTDAGITDWRWVTSMGATSGGNRVWTRRERLSNAAYYRGGEVMADDDAGRISYIDSEDAASNTFLSVFLGQAQLANGRLSVSPPASSSSALYVSAATGHTGNLLRAQLNLVDKFAVSTTGAVTAAGAVSAASVTTTGAITAGGILSAGNWVSGSVAITPSAANTPTSVSVSGLSVQGSNFRAYVSIANPAPGYTSANNGVTGVGFSNLTSSGITIWATRQNTTALTVHWMILGV